jgi:hypothetical protein
MAYVVHCRSKLQEGENIYFCDKIRRIMRIFLSLEVPILQVCA